jgi:intracellular sulfur oxidation DsrE/DsrF family protein
MTDRRSFVARLGAGFAAFGAALAATPAPAHAASAQGRWAPDRHPQDDWLDQVPGRHRFFYDTTTPNGAGDAITFATNFYAANRSGYDLGDKDLAVVICLRHWSTPFAWSDAMWAKYAAPISERIRFVDPRTQQPPTINVYQSSAYGMQLPNRGTTFDVLIRRGVQFAVCDMATRAFAGIIAGKVGAKADDVYADLRANSIANCHYVPAGIVAVNRAQERGYALIQMG